MAKIRKVSTPSSRYFIKVGLLCFIFPRTDMSASLWICNYYYQNSDCLIPLLFCSFFFFMTLGLFSSLGPHAPAPGADVPFSRAAPHLRPVSAADFFFFFFFFFLSWSHSMCVQFPSAATERVFMSRRARKKKDAARDKGVFMEMHGLV